MNTDKTSGFPSLFLIRDNPCYPWSKKPGQKLEQKITKETKKPRNQQRATPPFLYSWFSFVTFCSKNPSFFAAEGTERGHRGPQNTGQFHAILLL
jgi:hypothetical protein